MSCKKQKNVQKVSYCSVEGIVVRKVGLVNLHFSQILTYFAIRILVSEKEVPLHILSCV